MQEKLYFYYTNDLHSYFKNWSRVVGFLKNETAKREENNESYWIADIGDFVDRVNPIAEAFMGKANVELLNEAGYDLATIGNNEGITLSHEDLYTLYNKAEFQVVCANLYSMGESPSWLNTTVHVQSLHGVKIGVIGLTAPFNDYYELLDWHVSSPYEELEKHISNLKESTDVIVLLSHLGINDDREIARRFPDIDVIIGGHTHHLLRTGEELNNTIITAAGKHCSYVGEVILTWDDSLGKLVNKEAYAIDITHLPKDLETEKHLFHLNEESAQHLDKAIVFLEEPIEVKWFDYTDIMKQLTDTMKAWTKADCAMLNAGLLLDRFPAGDVTYSNIHSNCPHPINPCVVELKGDELIEVIRASLTKDFMELKLKGFGFRGEVIGRMIFSGLDVITEKYEDGQEFVKSVYYNGLPLNSYATYTVALPDTFTFGRLLPEVAKSEVKNFFLPEFIRDLLVLTLEREYK